VLERLLKEAVRNSTSDLSDQVIQIQTRVNEIKNTLNEYTMKRLIALGKWQRMATIQSGFSFATGSVVTLGLFLFAEYRAAQAITTEEI
jgi:hypothetical protein